MHSLTWAYWHGALSDVVVMEDHHVDGRQKLPKKLLTATLEKPSSMLAARVDGAGGILIGFGKAAVRSKKKANKRVSRGDFSPTCLRLEMSWVFKSPNT